MTKFPDLYWANRHRAEIALIAFLTKRGWRTACDPGDYSVSGTQAELAQLLTMQGDPERKARAGMIIQEADSITDDFAQILLYSKERHVHTSRVFSSAVMIGSAVVMYYKNKYKRPRPAMLEPRLRPLVPAPGHASYPSGHSTQMHLVAAALGEITGAPADVKAQLVEIADRVAVNREWGGVHYSSDSEAGRRLAQTMYPRFKAACGVDFKHAIREWR